MFCPTQPPQCPEQFLEEPALAGVSVYGRGGCASVPTYLTGAACGGQGVAQLGSISWVVTMGTLVLLHLPRSP